MLLHHNILAKYISTERNSDIVQKDRCYFRLLMNKFHGDINNIPDFYHNNSGVKLDKIPHSILFD